MIRLNRNDAARDTGYTEFIGEPITFLEFIFPRIPDLSCFGDGLLGRRCLFLSNDMAGYTLTFEEGMGSMDETLDSEKSIVKHISSSRRIGERYIHQLRTDPETRPGIGNYAFFHMEIPDESGTLHILPGQMTAKVEHQWSDGVEPILLELLEGISVTGSS